MGIFRRRKKKEVQTGMLEQITKSIKEEHDDLVKGITEPDFENSSWLTQAEQACTRHWNEYNKDICVSDTYDIYKLYLDSPTTRSYNNTYSNNTTLTTTDMNNTVSNQEQQVESVAKYLTDKRENASEVVELNIKEYNKLIQKNAELEAKVKADQDVIRVETTEDYDDDTIITYVGKDKALADAAIANNEAQAEIRDLKQQLTILNEEITESNRVQSTKMNKFEKQVKQEFEDKLEKDNIGIVKGYKRTIKELNSTIDSCNESIQEANDRNSILSNMNNRYRNTLDRILSMVPEGRLWRLFKRTFGLNILLDADSCYRVSTYDSRYNDIYVNSTTGSWYRA